MKVLHYIPSLDEKSGGVGAYMQLISRDLGKLCELHVLTHKEDNERVLRNCTVHYMPYKWMPWDNCKKEFQKILNEVRPDVFHTNCCWQPVSAMVALWAKDAGYKVVYTPHGMLEPYAIARHYWTKKLPAILIFQKKGVKVCDLVHATANTEKQNLLNLGWNKNVHVIANCVQIDEIEIKSTWRRNKNVLYLSRVHPKKGINFLIEAVAQLKNEFTGYTFTIAGSGEESYIKELKKLCSELKVNNMFEFVGSVFGEAKWPLYRKADLFVLPTYSENFGIVVLEALASGTPVITTFGTPWAELNGISQTPHSSLNSISVGQCGWCTEIGTPPTVEALKKFLACRDSDLEQMGRHGRKLVEDKYASTTAAKQFMEIYEKLLHKAVKE